MVKLIRSKGVGIYFITQIPGDVPENVLSQLGLKIQHALRGFTAKDRKEIDKAVENYPITEYYDAGNLIQNLGIGEAFITALDEKGIPTPLVHTYLISPESRMDVLTNDEIDDLVNASDLATKYNKEIDKESAYEILTKRMEQAVAAEQEVEKEEVSVEPEKKVNEDLENKKLCLSLHAFPQGAGKKTLLIINKIFCENGRVFTSRQEARDFR